jgi:hypothetical protein
VLARYSWPALADRYLEGYAQLAPETQG